MPVQKKKPEKIVRLELSLDEVNVVLDALTRQPFINVYRIIEKIHVQSRNGIGNAK